MNPFHPFLDYIMKKYILRSIMTEASIFYTKTLQWYMNSLGDNEATEFAIAQLEDGVRIGKLSEQALAEANG